MRRLKSESLNLHLMTFFLQIGSFYISFNEFRALVRNRQETKVVDNKQERKTQLNEIIDAIANVLKSLQDVHSVHKVTDIEPAI